MTHRAQGHGEVELKFELDHHAARKVQHHPLLADAGHRTRAQKSVYFDTDKGAVHKAGYSLRVRQVEDCFTQTVKTNGGSAGLFDRGEWEAPVEQMAPDPRALKQTPLGKLKKLHRKLEPMACSDVERTTWLVDHDGSAIEVVLDSGTVSAGGEEAPFHELEFELKGGEAAALFDFAQELGQAVSLEIGVLSKEERGLMLADGALGHESKASTPNLRPGLDAGQAFALIVNECVRHFRLNEALIVTDRDPHGLHQARVAVRRLRTAFSLFRPAIRQSSIDPLRQELREFIEPFGEARNLDVFLANHGEGLHWRERHKLKAARADAYDRVIDALNGQRSRDMLLDLVEWTASENWRKGAARAPIGKFAAKRLDEQWKRVKRRGSKLGDLKEMELHRLRISIKKLRYAVEFMAPLYAKKQVRNFASKLEAMQDCLGLLHDDIVSRQIVTDFALESLGRTDVSSRARQLSAMDKRFRRLKRVGRFWTN